MLQRDSKGVANLPEAHALLKSYIAENLKTLNDELKKEVFSLYSRLEILFAQQGSLVQGGFGLIADYYAELFNPEKKPQTLTQQQLIDEAIKLDEGTRAFTIKILEGLVKDINKLLKLSLPSHLSKKLNEIKPLIEATLLNTEKQKQDGGLHQFTEGDPIISLAKSLNIAFIPYKQGLDPIKERKNEGHCYGHVMMWSKNVTVKSIPSFRLFRANPESYKHQISQVKTSIKTTKFSKNKAIRSAIQEMIPFISSNNVYELCVGFKEIDGGPLKYHSIGIRRCQDGRYELFEPNFGIFVFENILQLEKLLCSLMHHYTKDALIKHGEFTLREIAKQPAKAVASIPTLEFESKLREKKFIILKRHLIDEPVEQAGRLYILKKNADEFLYGYSIDQKYEACISEQQMDLYRYFGECDEAKRNESNKEEVAVLKNSVDRKIDAEIRRLEKTLFWNKKDKKLIIHGLKELKTKINDASPVQTLSVVIHQWLESKPENFSRSYNEIISPYKTRDFINNLEENHEICPYYLNLMRARVVEQLRHMLFEQSWESFTNDPSKVPPGIQSLRNAYASFQAGQYSLRDFLDVMKGFAKLHHRENFFTLHFRGQNPEVNKLLACLSQIQIDDSHSLDYHFNKMKVFNDEHLKNKDAINACNNQVGQP